VPASEPPVSAKPDRAGAATLRLPEFRIEPGEKGSSYDIDRLVEKSPAAEAYEIAKEGTKVGRFEVRKVLGRGAFGQVYCAFDPLLRREVALKVFKGALGHPDALQQRQREARAVARLRHQNIVAVFEEGLNDRDYFIASELINGQPMSTLIAQSAIAPRRAAIWVRELARALAYAHLEGLVHRDVKPANILIDDRDRTQIIDFGLAYHVGEATTTASRTPVGTPAYMAPEQAKGDSKAVGSLSDQYSLGVVLYELLTRRRPFEGEPQAILKQLQRDNPPRPRKLNPKIHPDLEAICLKAMARKPADRYPDLAKLAGDLGHWLAGEPVSVRPWSMTRLVARAAWKQSPLIAFIAVAISAIVLAVGLFAGLARKYVEDMARVNELVKSASQHEQDLRNALTETRQPLARLYHRSAYLLAGKDDVLTTAHYLAAAAEHGRSAGDMLVYGPAREDLALLAGRLLPGRPAVPEIKDIPAPVMIDFPARGLRLGLGEAEPTQLWARPLRPWPDGSLSRFATALAIKAGATAAVVVVEHDRTGLWSASERTFSPLYSEEKWNPTAAAFSPDGKTVMIADDDRRLSLIDLDNGNRRIPPVIQADLITALAYAPDGSWVAVGGPSKAIWRIDPGTMHRGGMLLEHPVVPERLEFEDAGKVLTILGQDSVVRQWDAKTGVAVNTPVVLAERVVGLAAAPDGRVLRVLRNGKDVNQSDRSSSSRFAQIFGPDGRPDGPPFELAFEDDPTRTPTVRRRSGNSTNVVDSSNRGAEPVPLDKFGNALVCVALSNDGKALLGVRRPDREFGELKEAGTGPFSSTMPSLAGTWARNSRCRQGGASWASAPMAASSRSNTQRRSTRVRTRQLASCSIRSPAGRLASL
jgi:hypothetical protein